MVVQVFEKKGSSLFGALMLAKVKVLFSVWMSIIINLPIGSEYDFIIWKVKLLLKSKPTPTLTLDKLYMQLCTSKRESNCFCRSIWYLFALMGFSTLII